MREVIGVNAGAEPHVEPPVAEERPEVELRRRLLLHGAEEHGQRAAHAGRVHLARRDARQVADAAAHDVEVGLALLGVRTRDEHLALADASADERGLAEHVRHGLGRTGVDEASGVASEHLDIRICDRLAGDEHGAAPVHDVAVGEGCAKGLAPLVREVDLDGCPAPVVRRLVVSKRHEAHAAPAELRGVVGLGREERARADAVVAAAAEHVTPQRLHAGRAEAFVLRPATAARLDEKVNVRQRARTVVRRVEDRQFVFRCKGEQRGSCEVRATRVIVNRRANRMRDFLRVGRGRGGGLRRETPQGGERRRAVVGEGGGGDHRVEMTARALRQRGGRHRHHVELRRADELLDEPRGRDAELAAAEASDGQLSAPPLRIRPRHLASRHVAKRAAQGDVVVHVHLGVDGEHEDASLAVCSRQRRRLAGLRRTLLVRLGVDVARVGGDHLNRVVRGRASRHGHGVAAEFDAHVAFLDAGERLGAVVEPDLQLGPVLSAACLAEGVRHEAEHDRAGLVRRHHEAAARARADVAAPARDKILDPVPSVRSQRLGHGDRTAAGHDQRVHVIKRAAADGVGVHGDGFRVLGEGRQLQPPVHADAACAVVDVDCQTQRAFRRGRRG